MERSVQIKRKLAVCMVCLLCMTICGCSMTTDADSFLADHNQYPVEIFDGQEEKELYCLVSDTQNICIVEDELQYDRDYIRSAAGIVFNLDTNEVLYSKNARQSLPVASLTKLMTALLVLESGTMNQTVIAGNEVNITEYNAWLCHFQTGDVLSVEDLMYATLIYSGNDGAAALAAYAGGTVEDFVDRMNERAQELGADDTHFANPHGLDAEGHYSSLYDMYLIFRQCMKYKQFLDIIHTDSHTCHYAHGDGTQVSRTFPNTNWYFTGEAQPPEGITILGGKTGNTPKAHRCLILLVKNEAGDRFLTGILGAEDQTTLYQEMNQLLKFVL